MKRKFKKSVIMIFSLVFVLFLSACQNPFLVKATKLYNANFETNCDTKIASYRTSKIESIQELTKTEYIFDGWYTNATFEGSPVSFPYELTEDTTFYAKWLEKCEIHYETSYNIAPTVIGKGKKISSEYLPVLSNNDYYFDGWYIEDVRIEPEKYVVNGNITLVERWLEKCEISYKTEQGNAPASVTTGIGKTITFDQLPELTSDGYSFEGWYIGEKLIVANEYEVTSKEVTLTAKWVIIFDTENIKNSTDYVNGNLSLKSDYDKVIFKGDSSEVFSNLCIKVSNQNTKLIFDNFSFSSSKATPLIESAFDISIECKGTNKLLSASSSVDSLIKSLGTIEFKGNDKSLLLLQPNGITTVDCAIVRANEVVISGGNIEIGKSDCCNNSTAGRSGGNGSTGIKANVIVKNNAVVTITAGNGANGNNGQDNSKNKANKGTTNGAPWGTAGDGDPGISGGDAGNGGNGGNAISGSLKIISGNITLLGGKGGAGGDGGQGGIGGDGGDNTAAYSYTGAGGKGGKGGKAGKGGNGGDAINGHLDNSSLSLVNLIPGKCGENGKPGLGGIGGGIGWHIPPMGGVGSHKKPAGDTGDLGDLPDAPPCDGVEYHTGS